MGYMTDLQLWFTRGELRRIELARDRCRQTRRRKLARIARSEELSTLKEKGVYREEC